MKRWCCFVSMWVDYPITSVFSNSRVDFREYTLKLLQASASRAACRTLKTLDSRAPAPMSIFTSASRESPVSLPHRVYATWAPCAEHSCAAAEEGSRVRART